MQASRWCRHQQSRAPWREHQDHRELVDGADPMPEIALHQYDYTPQLGWSSTRWETFRTCRRRYFYQYYARYDREFSGNGFKA